MLRILALAAMALCSVTAHAGAWYAFSDIDVRDTAYFFDADTVARQGDKITFWAMAVQKSDSPNPDSSYSKAAKWAYSCSRRTAQELTVSAYDKTGQFIRADPSPSKERDVVPGSVVETILDTVCANHFPQDQSGKHYVRIDDNDIYRAAGAMFDARAAQNTDPAPRATWYVFTNVSDPTLLVFFDLDSVVKNADSVTIWQKTVHEPGSPGQEGSQSMAQKVVYSCSDRATQVLMTSLYDGSGQFMRALTTSGRTEVIVPGTSAEAVLETVCRSDFPDSASVSTYVAVKDNNIYGFANAFFDFVASKRNDPTPQ